MTTSHTKSNIKSMSSRWFLMQQGLLMGLLLIMLLPFTWYAVFALLPCILVWRAILQRWAHIEAFFAAYCTVFVLAFHLFSTQFGLPSEWLFMIVSMFIIQCLSFVFYQRACQFGVFKPTMIVKPLLLNGLLLMLLSGGVWAFKLLPLSYPLTFSALLLSIIVVLMATQMKTMLYRTKKIQ